MSKQPMPKQKDTKKPLFERCDVVRVMGVPSPLMLVIDVSKDTDLNDEFAVGVIYFHEGAPVDNKDSRRACDCVPRDSSANRQPWAVYRWL
jgi:hypothetical protein